jgi:hypothetical protein
MNNNLASNKVNKYIRKEKMEMKTKDLTRTLIIFIALTIAGVSLVVFGQEASIAAVRNTLPLLGTAMFASALTFFMVDLTH